MQEKSRRNLLVSIADDRDERSFQTLFDGEAPLIAVRLRSRGASSQDVEDILQETFLTVWQRASTYREEGSVAAWIWVIARNKWVSRQRSEKRMSASELLDIGVEFASPDASIDAARSLEDLPVEMREVIEAVGVRGLSMEEAARELGLPEGTVKSRLHRARARLKEKLG